MAGRAGEIDWVYMDRADEAHARRGELISADAGGLPIYQVMDFSGDRARLRDTRDGSDRVAPIDAFHWKALPQA
jgi:hypothetical protein